MFRVGKPLDNLQIILKSSKIKDELERSFIVCKALGFGGWLTLDALQWLSVQGIITLSPNLKEFVNKNAPRLWFFGLASSLSLNLYKIHRQHPILKNCSSKSNNYCIDGITELIKKADGEVCQSAKDALQDVVDLIIPLSLMGTVPASPGVVGLAGTFTSVLALTSIWPKQK